MTPIALFVYGRPDHTQQTLQALLNNRRTDETELVIFCDGARSAEAAPKVQETRDLVKAMTGNMTANTSAFQQVTIVEREENWGLTRSIIEGIDSIITRTGRVIVVEDDLVTSPHFLPYMLNALDFYQDAPSVFTISGHAPPPQTMPIPEDYPFDAYFNHRNAAWGWATWIDRWNKMDFDVHDYEEFKNTLSLQMAFNRGGEDMTQMLFHQKECGLGTWDIQMSYSLFRNRAVSLCPRYSLVDNIGLDGSGEHCGEADHMRVDLKLAKDDHKFPRQVFVDERIMDSFRAIYARPIPGLIGGGAEDYWSAKRSPADNKRLMSAQSWLEIGALDKAKELLEEHLHDLPHDPAAQTLLGYIAIEIQKPDLAVTLFRQAMQSYGDYAPAMQGFQTVYAQVSDELR